MRTKKTGSSKGIMFFEIKNYKFIWNLEGCTYLKHTIR